MIIGARREFYDDLGSRLLLRVVQRSEPADDLDGVLLGGLGLVGLRIVFLLRHLETVQEGGHNILLTVLL